VVKRQ